eukprot:gb/GECG01001805.1/.p1 GENE.gb/GECG01001805.1/~~gb/GECG01001805.1/.p1  ORF type:complete len:864 (+),score=149.12 gb/GECG01001805.1/:1-2592(+)
MTQQNLSNRRPFGREVPATRSRSGRLWNEKKNEKLQKDLKECTFRPSINENSDRLVKMARARKSATKASRHFSKPDVAQQSSHMTHGRPHQPRSLRDPANYTIEDLADMDVDSLDMDSEAVSYTNEEEEEARRRRRAAIDEVLGSSWNTSNDTGGEYPPASSREQPEPGEYVDQNNTPLAPNLGQEETKVTSERDTGVWKKDSDGKIVSGDAEGNMGALDDAHAVPSGTGDYEGERYTTTYEGEKRNSPDLKKAVSFFPQQQTLEIPSSIQEESTESPSSDVLLPLQKEQAVNKEITSVPNVKPLPHLVTRNSGSGDNGGSGRDMRKVKSASQLRKSSTSPDQSRRPKNNRLVSSSPRRAKSSANLRRQRADEVKRKASPEPYKLNRKSEHVPRGRSREDGRSLRRSRSAEPYRSSSERESHREEDNNISWKDSEAPLLQASTTTHSDEIQGVADATSRNNQTGARGSIAIPQGERTSHRSLHDAESSLLPAESTTGEHKDSHLQEGVQDAGGYALADTQKLKRSQSARFHRPALENVGNSASSDAEPVQAKNMNMEYEKLLREKQDIEKQYKELLEQIPQGTSHKAAGSPNDSSESPPSPDKKALKRPKSASVLRKDTKQISPRSELDEIARIHDSDATREEYRGAWDTILSGKQLERTQSSRWPHTEPDIKKRSSTPPSQKHDPTAFLSKASTVMEKMRSLQQITRMQQEDYKALQAEKSQLAKKYNQLLNQQKKAQSADKFSLKEQNDLLREANRRLEQERERWIQELEAEARDLNILATETERSKRELSDGLNRLRESKQNVDAAFREQINQLRHKEDMFLTWLQTHGLGPSFASWVSARSRRSREFERMPPQLQDVNR